MSISQIRTRFGLRTCSSLGERVDKKWVCGTKWHQFWEARKINVTPSSSPSPSPSPHSSLCLPGEQGWRSGENTHLPPMWLGFESRARCHMRVEFVVGSRSFSESFFSGYSGFPLCSKTNISKFQFDVDHEPLAREIVQTHPVLLTSNRLL